MWGFRKRSWPKVLSHEEEEEECIDDCCCCCTTFDRTTTISIHSRQVRSVILLQPSARYSPHLDDILPRLKETARSFTITEKWPVTTEDTFLEEFSAYLWCGGNKMAYLKGLNFPVVPKMKWESGKRRYRIE